VVLLVESAVEIIAMESSMCHIKKPAIRFLTEEEEAEQVAKAREFSSHRWTTKVLEHFA
jgi:hypothetical protein